MPRIVVFFAWLMVAAPLQAQRYAFINYTPKDGLINNRSRFIFQDSRGRLYISTFGGLSVYDGARFTNYTTENGLAASLINQVLEWGDDTLLLVPNTSQLQLLIHGVVRNYPTTDHYTPVTNELVKCSDGYFYAITDNGLFRFSLNRFSRIPLWYPDGKTPLVNSYHGVEHNGVLYMITDPNNSAFHGKALLAAYDIGQHKSLSSIFIPPAFCICCSPQGEILICTVNGIFTVKTLTGETPALRLVQLPPSPQLPAGFHTKYIFFDSRDNRWLLGPQGVARIAPGGGTTWFNSQNGLPENQQEFLFEDREHIIWLAGAHRGISKFVNQQLIVFGEMAPGFHSDMLTAAAGSDSLWLYDISRHRLLLRHGAQREVFLSSSAIAATKLLFLDHAVYLVGVTEIFRLDLDHRRHQFTPRLLVTDSTASNGFTALQTDGRGNLLAISDEVLCVLSNGKTLRHHLGYLADQAALCKNKLWVATRAHKLFLFEVHPDDPDHYLQLVRIFEKELSSIGPRSIAMDSKDRLWIGTRDHGLFCYGYRDSLLELTMHLTVKDGLSENFVSYLHSDDQGNIWACSPAGLDQIIDSGQTCYVDNITRRNDIFQQVSTIATTHDGTHWVQTAEGVVAIGRERPLGRGYAPPVLIFDVKAGDSLLDASVQNPALSYERNDLSFSLAAPTYYDEKSTRFSYLLKGSENNQWSEPSTQTEIHFVNLEPAKYELVVQAYFLHGHFARQEATFPFTVLAPWWQTWWCRSLMVLAVAALIFWVIRSYYKNKLKKQLIELEKQQAIERERNRIATDMHDDLGAGLSRIKFLSEMINIRQQRSEPIGEDIGKIKDYANEMIEKMGEIVWALNEKNDSLSDLLAYTRAYVSEYLLQHGIASRITMPDQVPAHFVSGEMRRNIYLTVKEALHNVVKHAQATEVIFSVAMDAQGLIIRIHDDGIGMDQASAKPFRSGLSSMHKRIRDIGGSLGLYRHSGTLIEITIPLG